MPFNTDAHEGHSCLIMILDRKMVFLGTLEEGKQLFKIFNKELLEISAFSSQAQVSLKPILRFFWLQQELCEVVMLPAVVWCLMHLNGYISPCFLPIAGPVPEPC